MGSVFLARHPGTQAPIAIKVQHELNPERIARFTREAEVMSRIQDPRVVRALDAGLHEGELFLVLEYCPGQDLGEVLKTRGALEPREAARLMAEVGRGLAAAHAQGVLHRDLKPANVLLDSAGNPKVADFGLARVEKEPGAQSLTQSGVIMGTPAYMAPEQANDARQVDVRSDVYALGAILYECLSGDRPFGTGGALAILQRVCAGQLEPLPAELPPELVEVVTCAMAIDPADRYSEASLFVAALEEALAAPAQGGSTSWVPLVGGVGLLIALALGVTWGLDSGPGTSPVTPRAKPSEALPGSPSPVVTDSAEGSRAPAPRLEFPRPETPEYFPARVRFWKAPLAEVQAEAAAGHPAAQTRLAAALLSGQGVPKNAKRGLDLARQAAEAGDTEAMLLLVSHYKNAPESREWKARALQSRSPEAQLTRALLKQDAEGIRAAAKIARERLAAGDPAASVAVAFYASFSGDFEAAAEVTSLGCKFGVPAAHSLRARLARARGGARSQEVYEDFRYAAERRDVEGLCGQARWLLDQEQPTPADRQQAERLLREAEVAGYGGAKVERILGLWRAGERAAWFARVRELMAESRAALPNSWWGELGVHLNEVFRELSVQMQRELRPATREAIRRGRPAWSLDPRVTYYGAFALYRAGPEARKESMALFARAAGAGHPQASHAWGVALVHGDGVERNVPRGVKALERAGRAGHFLSWKWLGDLYASRRTGERDLDKAIGYYLLAAKDPGAAPSLHGTLAIALRVAERHEESRAWGERAAAGGDPMGSACLAGFLLNGPGARDPERGIRLLRSLVDLPQHTAKQLPTAIRASSMLSDAYRLGQGVSPDPKLEERYRARALLLRKRMNELRAARSPR